METFFQNHKYILAPMAGVNDFAFRQLCLEGGADLTYTEMVSSMGLNYSNQKTRDMLYLADNESQVVVQIFGHDPGVMSKQAQKIEDSLGAKLAYIDINMGCPVRKIVKKGDGAALMQEPKLAAEVVKSCVDSCKHPITVKFRLGWYMNENIAIEFAKKMEDAGARAVCIHGRYAMQYYSGINDWDTIESVVKNVNIPVIGSGDIADCKTAQDAFAKGVSAIMIGRAARGNPYIFDVCKGEMRHNSVQEKIRAGKRHLELFNDKYPRLIRHMRKHCIWYSKGLKGATQARIEFSSAETFDEFNGVFDKLAEIN